MGETVTVSEDRGRHYHTDETCPCLANITDTKEVSLEEAKLNHDHCPHCSGAVDQDWTHQQVARAIGRGDIADPFAIGDER